jgi:hypothetical protein
MITRFGLVGFLLTAVGILLVLEIIPLGEPLRSLSLTAVFMSVGILAFLKTERVISPIFVSSQINLWLLRAFGLFMMLLGLAGFIGLVGGVLGFW